MALTPWQQAVFDDAKRNNLTVADLMARPGWEGVSAQQIQTVLTGAGLDLPMTKAPEQARQAQQAIDAGTTKPLTDWQRQTYVNAINTGKTSDDLAQQWQHLGVTKHEIDTILSASGLSLSPGGTGGAGIPSTTQNQGSDANYPGGLPMIQPPGAGMYGPIPSIEMPRGTFGQAPMLPGLRMVRQNARQRNRPGWSGTTDTILTSGRGVTDAANLQVRTLLGA